IKEAIESHKKIVIYGDYDADGVISTYILFTALRKCGANVTYYIPDREWEGYGINIDRLKTLHSEGCQVLITCDNGIAAINEIKCARELGMSVVITDHHEVPFIEDEDGNRTIVLPEANAIIDPKQPDCHYPFKQLCGASVAYKVSEVLYEKMGIRREEANQFIEYAAIATICDVVDVLYENRIIAKIGLDMLNNTKNIGLKALIKTVGMEGKKIKSYHVGFIIGPCINATGRLEKADLSLKLLLCQDPAEADEIAMQLRELNEKRQSLTEKGFENVCRIINNYNYLQDKVLIVYEPSVHESVAGIIAGRVKEKYNRPTIILTDSKDELFAKGSGRSIEKYNMFEELSKLKYLMEKFGGHQMAAGLTIKKENINELRKKLNENSPLTESDLIPKLTIDSHVPISDVSIDLINDIEALEPFGKGNPSPIFGDKKINVDRFYIVGSNKNTLKLILNTENNHRIDAVGFNQVEKFINMLENKFGIEKAEEMIRNQKCDTRLDIAFVPALNTYNGITSVQLRLYDFRISNA
ncbi:MAG TPA: single-stranded-DNA-specific exonuclease RecJ, partial [Clostridiaceae bacterium]|nr:single-stranded-DNA-specific exonuclease RecJ [Clostridiaceae bacterium]